MAASTLPLALEQLFGHEGGLSMIRSDPGNWTGGKVGKGRLLGTKYGIAANSYPHLNIPALTLDEAAAIYRKDYWGKVKGDVLPAGIDFATFDEAVNAGPSRGAKTLQKAIGAKVDGVIGGQTLVKASAAADKPAVVRKQCAIRLGFLRSLRTWGTFGKGWARRVASVEAFGVKLALRAAGAAVVPAVVEAEKQATADKNKADAGAVGSAAGAGGSGGAASVPDLTGVPPAVFAVVGLVFLVALLVYLWRSRVHKARAEAYRNLAEGK